MPSAAPAAEFGFNAGAEERIRQELFDHVPGLPGGGVLSDSVMTKFRDQMRFRTRLWGEATADTDFGRFRLNLRLVDEFRNYFHTNAKPKYRWPDEVIIDNLFLEGKDLFGGVLDFKVGRQDLEGLYGLDHLFSDGTPGDFSRSFYGDLASFALKFTEESRLDLFAIYDEDDNVLRWGTDDDAHRSLTGFGGGAEPEMDDWGFGAIWGSNLAPGLPYQIYVLQKNTREFHRDGVEHPWAQRELVGTKVVPQLDEEWSLQFEAAGEVGCNAESATLSGWYGYSGVNWKSARAGAVKPLGSIGYQFMSGDDDAADEDGGHSAWDPMWGRGIRESILFCYGTHYGAGWWSNMHYLKFAGGVEFGRHHFVKIHCGPMFAAAQDGLGGADGMFKGLLSQARYEFPIFLPDKKKGERLEIFGHLLAELFNPGDYFESRRPAWLLRWQVEFKF